MPPRPLTTQMWSGWEMYSLRLLSSLSLPTKSSFRFGTWSQIVSTASAGSSFGEESSTTVGSTFRKSSTFSSQSGSAAPRRRPSPPLSSRSLVPSLTWCGSLLSPGRRAVLKCRDWLIGSQQSPLSRLGSVAGSHIQSIFLRVLCLVDLLLGGGALLVLANGQQSELLKMICEMIFQPSLSFFFVCSTAPHRIHCC